MSKKIKHTANTPNNKSKNFILWLFDQFLDLYKKHTEIVMYLIMGVATTLVNFIMYSVAFTYMSCGSSVASFLNNFGMSLTAKDVDMTIANAIAWVVAVLFAYFTNKILVFHSHVWKPRFVLKEIGLFVSARLITGVLEIVCPPILFKLGIDIKIFGIEGLVSKSIVAVAVIILNYIFSKLFIFKNKQIEDENKDTETK